MLLDLNDSLSIVQCWAVYPSRHGALLSDWARRRPEHRAAIADARRLINADPEKRALLQLAQRDPVVEQLLSTDDVVPSHDELAAERTEH
ncbi:hypothetical protein [Roseateles noduli]|uniref:hypothetical protein n=1 Tax=Roseateles noduli TaxID=2052484 RepID=UPI003D64CBE4